MSEPYIIYNGVDSRTLGVVIERLPDFVRPARVVQMEQIPGRDGREVRDDGAYDIVTSSMRVNCYGVPLANVYAWLSGEGWLISSDEPNRKVWAIMHSQIQDRRFRCEGCYDSLTLSVTMQPYRYHHPEPEATVITTSPGTVNNTGTAKSRPRITVYGSGDVSLMVGLNQIDLEGLTDGIVIDSELMDCFNTEMTLLANDKAEMDDFPTLEPGANGIMWTGSVTQVKIEGRFRDL